MSIGSFAVAARDSIGQEKPAAKITYDEQIVPIFRDKCFGCHNPDKKSGGLILNSFTSLMAGGGSGEVIERGDPSASRLYALVTHKEEPKMPPKSDKLPAEQLELIKKWIEGGALENSGSKATASNKPKFDLALKSVPTKKPDGPPTMPQNLLLEPVVRTARATAVTAIASSPWAPLVAVAGQKQVVLYNSETLDIAGVLPFPEGVPQVLKFSRNGALVLAAGGRGAKSGRVVVFNITNGERAIEVGDEFDTVLAADISADQTLIALGGSSKMVRIYSTTTGEKLFDIKKHTDWVTALEFSPDGVLLATGDRNGGLFVWESNTAREYLTLRAHTAMITDVSFRSDGNVLASSSEDTTLRLWEMENGGNIKGWGAHGGGVAAVRFTHDGRLVSTGRDRVTKVWDQNGSAQKQFEAFADIGLRCTFTHDGGRVIAGDWTGDIRVWNAADAKLIGQLAPNPPTLAERIDSTNKELAALKPVSYQAAATATASAASVQKAGADLAAAQKLVTDTAAAAKSAADAVPKAKDAADKAVAAISAAQTAATNKDTAAKAAAQAAVATKDAVAKAPENKDLAEAAAKTKTASDQLASEFAVAQKALTDAQAAAKSAADQFAAAQALAQKLAADAAAAPKQVESLTPVAKAAADIAAADKVASDQAAARFAAAQATLAKWTAALAAAKQAADQARATAAPPK